MRTFIADIIPKIQRFSEKLDNYTLLTNQHWVVFDDINSAKNVYIFRSNNQLLISKNGKVEKGRWENIGNSSLLIDLEKESFLFKHGFFDQNILALKLDGKNEYAFLINENKYAGELNSYEKIIDFLIVNYLDKPLPIEIEEESKIKNKRVIKAQIELTKIETPKGVIYVEGAKTYMDGKRIFANLRKEPAKDGKYQIGFMWYIHVENGIVKRTSIF